MNGARLIPARAVVIFLAACACFAGCSAARSAAGGLAFATDTIALTATTTRAPLHASFAFRNDGPAQVAITAIETSCDCASAAPPDGPYAPGASGALDVIFDPHNLGGEHAVTLRVHLATGGVIPLHLRVTLPPATVVDQTIVVWALGGAPTTRTVAVTCHGVVMAATSNDPNVSVAVRAVEAGTRYLLDITPRTTAMRLLATIHVTVQPDGDVTLFAAVGGALGK